LKKESRAICTGSEHGPVNMAIKFGPIRGGVFFGKINYYYFLSTEQTDREVTL
jgi:hypothetical protein